MSLMGIFAAMSRPVSGVMASAIDKVPFKQTCLPPHQWQRDNLSLQKLDFELRDKLSTIIEPKPDTSIIGGFKKSEAILKATRLAKEKKDLDQIGMHLQHVSQGIGDNFLRTRAEDMRLLIRLLVTEVVKDILIATLSRNRFSVEDPKGKKIYYDEYTFSYNLGTLDRKSRYQQGLINRALATYFGLFIKPLVPAKSLLAPAWLASTYDWILKQKEQKINVPDRDVVILGNPKYVDTGQDVGFGMSAALYIHGDEFLCGLIQPNAGFLFVDTTFDPKAAVTYFRCWKQARP